MKHHLSILFLLFIASLAQAQPQPGPTLKQQLANKKLSSIVFENISLDDSILTEAIHVLTKRVEKETGGNIKLQWVYQGFDREEWEPTVTLTEKRISAAKLLQAIVDQTNLRARLDDHAIVLVPKTSRPEPKR